MSQYLSMIIAFSTHCKRGIVRCQNCDSTFLSTTLINMRIRCTSDSHCRTFSPMKCCLSRNSKRFAFVVFVVWWLCIIFELDQTSPFFASLAECISYSTMSRCEVAEVKEDGSTIKTEGCQIETHSTVKSQHRERWCQMLFGTFCTYVGPLQCCVSAHLNRLT